MLPAGRVWRGERCGRFRHQSWIIPLLSRNNTFPTPAPTLPCRPRIPRRPQCGNETEKLKDWFEIWQRKTFNPLKSTRVDVGETFSSFFFALVLWILKALPSRSPWEDKREEQCSSLEISNSQFLCEFIRLGRVILPDSWADLNRLQFFVLIQVLNLASFSFGMGNSCVCVFYPTDLFRDGWME